MAEYEDEEIAHPADPPAALVDFVGQFSDPQAQGAMRDAAVRVQDYVVRRQIAADNNAAANQFVNNLSTFKDGLASMAHDDPAAVGLGLDLVPDIVDGLVRTNPFLPDDQRDDMAGSLTADIQREIARSGVLSLADRDAAAARALLSEERVAGLFSEQDAAGLNGYIGAMDNARGMDAAAVAQQRAVDDARTRDFSMVQHLSGLVDKATGGLQFVGGWAQRVIADGSIPPAQTAGMLGIYRRLQQNGDVQSDPYVVADLVDGIAGGRVRDAASVLSRVGESLSVGDAAGLAYSAMNPTAQREMAALSATIGAARRTLAAPENGPAGAAAFGRFMNWLLPSYKAAGAGSTNPDAENAIIPAGDAAVPFWNNFMPNGDDLVSAARLRSENRKPLDAILGPSRAARTTAVRG